MALRHTPLAATLAHQARRALANRNRAEGRADRATSVAAFRRHANRARAYHQQANRLVSAHTRLAGHTPSGIGDYAAFDARGKRKSGPMVLYERRSRPKTSLARLGVKAGPRSGARRPSPYGRGQLSYGRGASGRGR